MRAAKDFQSDQNRKQACPPYTDLVQTAFPLNLGWPVPSAKITSLKNKEAQSEASVEGSSSTVFFSQSPEAARVIRRTFNFNAEPPWDPS
nr:Biomphalaria glabrata ornithine decarboxylase-like [Biomphalaria glabrata]